MKVEPPKLEFSDVIDIKSMSKEELDMVPYDVMYWFCAVDHCHSYSRVRDYGIVDDTEKVPVTREFYWPRTKDPWINVFKHIRICGRHWKMYRQYWNDKTGPGIIKPKVEQAMYPVHKDELKSMIRHLKEQQLKLL